MRETVSLSSGTSFYFVEKITPAKTAGVVCMIRLASCGFAKLFGLHLLHLLPEL